MEESLPPPDPRERTATRMRFVAPPGMSLDPGTELTTIGRYEIIETLGKGAMGVVYMARDPLLDRTVAVKTIVSPRRAGQRARKAYLERFEREAKAAAKMQHPGIVTIFDVGKTDGGAPFMVLEYLPGESLADRLDRVRMPLGKAVQIAIDLASALAFAHKTRIVHRDVKPANVLHAGENRWKLADFGIVRMPDSDLTQIGIFMGTPGYAPPEAISKGNYTTQADVFAWGAVLYELLSGRIAYEGPDTKTTNSYVMKSKAPPPTDHDSSIPKPLSDVCMQALHPSTSERYKDAAAAEQALQSAWEYCLEGNLVSPSALVGREVPHREAGRTFHTSSKGTAAPSAPRLDSGEDTVVRDGPPEFQGIATAISSEVAKIDAPTVDPARTLPEGVLAVVQPTDSGPSFLSTVAADVIRDEHRAKTGAVGAARESVPGPRPVIWLAVILAAVVAGGGAAYLLLVL